MTRDTRRRTARDSAVPAEPAQAAAQPEPVASAPWAGRAALALVILCGVLLAALAFGPHSVADQYAETDFIGGYAAGARAIQAGRLDAARYGVTGPVYELTLAAAATLVRNMEVAGKLLSLLAACSTLLLWFRLVERRAGAVAALWTSAFLLTNPIFVRYGSSLTTDMLASLTQAAALYALFGRHGRRALPWAGVLTAVAILTRYNAVYLLPAALWSGAGRDPRAPRGAGGAGSAVMSLLLFVAGFAAVAAPWLVYSIAQGHVPGEALIHDFAFGAFAQGQGISWDEYASRLQPGFRSLGDVLNHDPAALRGRLLGNLVSHARLDVERVLWLPAAIACAVGALFSLAGGTWRRMLPLWAAGLLLYLSLVPVFHSERYSLALVPFYLSFAGIAVAAPVRALRPRGWPPAPQWALALAALALSAWVCAGYQRQVLRDLPLEVRPAAVALRADVRRRADSRTQARPEAASSRRFRLLARKPHLAFYAGVTHVPFPIVGTLGELAEFCRANGVGYVWFSAPEADMRPEFAFLLDREADVPGLTPLEFRSDRPARLYRIGERFGEAPAWMQVDSLRTLRVSRSLESVGAPQWRVALVCGLFAMREGDAPAALRHFEALIRMRPDFAQGYVLAAQALRTVGRPDLAEGAFQRAVQLDPRLASQAP